MIVVKLTMEKLDESRFFQGAKGTYCDLVLIENKNGPDQYGNDGFVKQDVSKEEREQGVQGEIVGNWKNIVQKSARPSPPTRRAPSGPPREKYRPQIPKKNPDLDQPEDDIPFRANFTKQPLFK